jgi:phage terminase large subunit-like protein
VSTGTVPAGTYHRLAFQRHLDDRLREGRDPAFPYRFDVAKAERFYRFAEKLKHYKGRWAGTSIVLEPHQKFRWGSILGWVHRDTGLRRFRNAYHELPRKQGKSLEAAIATLYLTFFDGEAGAEGYCAATKREQALIVFGDCKKLVQSSGLKTRLTVKVSSIYHDGTSARLQPLSADYDSTDGLNPSMVNVDEFHAHKSRGMVDVLETGTGARDQPLINKITTAGNDLVSPCGDEHDYACKILDRVLTDETYFAFIAHADVTDDWTLPETARKANPNYGVSVNPDDLIGKVAKAKGIPQAAATYKQKHLNLWVNAFAPCLSIDGWRQGQSAWTWEDMAHEPCWVGIDLAAKIDLCAASLVFPPTPTRRSWRLIQQIWTPADTVVERAHRDRAPYDVWIDQGWITAIPGTTISHRDIRDWLTGIRRRFDVHLVGFDPWHADQVIRDLIAEDGWGETQVVEVPQTFAHLTSAETRFQAEVLAANIDARGCPVTAWAVSNVIDQTDGRGNIQFSKKRSRGRIDPVKAATIGMSLYLRHPPIVVPDYARSILIVGGR